MIIDDSVSLLVSFWHRYYRLQVTTRTSRSTSGHSVRRLFYVSLKTGEIHASFCSVLFRPDVAKDIW